MKMANMTIYDKDDKATSPNLITYNTTLPVDPYEKNLIILNKFMTAMDSIDDVVVMDNWLHFNRNFFKTGYGNEPIMFSNGSAKVKLISGFTSFMEMIIESEELLSLDLVDNTIRYYTKLFDAFHLGEKEANAHVIDEDDADDKSIASDSTDNSIKIKANVLSVFKRKSTSIPKSKSINSISSINSSTSANSMASATTKSAREKDLVSFVDYFKIIKSLNSHILVFNKLEYKNHYSEVTVLLRNALIPLIIADIKRFIIKRIKQLMD